MAYLEFKLQIICFLIISFSLPSFIVYHGVHISWRSSSGAILYYPLSCYWISAICTYRRQTRNEDLHRSPTAKKRKKKIEEAREESKALLENMIEKEWSLRMRHITIKYLLKIKQLVQRMIQIIRVRGKEVVQEGMFSAAQKIIYNYSLWMIEG